MLCEDAGSPMHTVHFIALNGTRQSRTFKTKRSAELFERRLMRGQRVDQAGKVKCTACARAKARKRRALRRGGGGLLRAIKKAR